MLMNNMPAISMDDPSVELAFPTEPDGVSYLTVSLGKSLNAGESLSSSVDSSSLDPVLNYINQMLMEENMEEEVWFRPGDLALHNMEKSLYDALDEQSPDLPDKFQDCDASQFIGSPNSSLFGKSSIKSGHGTTATSTSYASKIIDSCWYHEPREYDQAVRSAINPLGQVPQSNLDSRSPFYTSSLNDSISYPNGLVKSSIKVKIFFDDDDCVLQFKRGLEEGSKFLPHSCQLVIDFENVSSSSRTKEDMLNGSRGRKNHEREDLGLVEAKATKQMASLVEPEEVELADMLDKALLCTEKLGPLCSTASSLSTDAIKDLQTGTPIHDSSGGKGQGNMNNSLVDLRALLILCAQAIFYGDLRTADELLKQIRVNSSPSGDGSQRLAHYFANGLEARMAGGHCGTQNYYASVASKRTSVADSLRAYQLHFSCCPFMRFSISYRDWMIQKLSQVATVLHIIDFGIGLGFKWPILIQKLGELAGGPPKLRITGIELPQPGLRPAQRIQETGCRLARYCERFNVPFEYNALPSRNWEAIKIEDPKIRGGETLVVTSLMRFENLLDETVEENSPKDAVLNLIRRINPDIFVHSLTHGSYNMPFFMTRFRESLFHLSSIYDMLDATASCVHKDSKERRILESEAYGWAVMNVLACEGAERVERPETYKQWQARYARAGFKRLPLDRAMMEDFQHNLKALYHKDFVLGEDGDWMLMGWKGRTMNATTCLVPA